MSRQESYKELSDLEVSPDAKLIADVYLTNGHPLVVCTNTFHLPVAETCTGGGESTTNSSVVTVSGTGLPGLVCDLGCREFGASEPPCLKD